MGRMKASPRAARLRVGLGAMVMITRGDTAHGAATSDLVLGSGSRGCRDWLCGDDQFVVPGTRRRIIACGLAGHVLREC
jgi:hypothetical protein